MQLLQRLKSHIHKTTQQWYNLDIRFCRKLIGEYEKCVELEYITYRATRNTVRSQKAFTDQVSVGAGSIKIG